MQKQCSYLRVLPVDSLNYYFQKRYNNLPWVKKFGLDHIKIKGDHILMHAWKPGYVQLTPRQADELKKGLSNGGIDVAQLPTLPMEWLATEESEPDLDGILDKVIVPGLFEFMSNESLDIDVTHPRTRRFRSVLEEIIDRVPLFPAIQNPYELRCFLEGVRAQKPKTIVEIGTASGGLLYCLSQLADDEALVVSIDYPGGPYGGGQDDKEVELYSSFGGSKQQISFIRDRSFHYSTKKDLIQILGERKIDLLFIDGDHSYGGVSSDYHMYKDLLAPNGVIAFHDINSHPESWGRGFDCGVFWNKVKQEYDQTEEIIDPNGCTNPLFSDQKESDYAYGIGKLLL